MPRKRKENGPTGPGDKEYIQIEVDDYVQKLMGATGSLNVSELVNKALATVAWAYESKNAGKRVFATRDEIEGHEGTQELKLDE